MTVRVRSVPPCVSSQIGSRHLPLKQGIVSSSLTWRTDQEVRICWTGGMAPKSERQPGSLFNPQSEIPLALAAQMEERDASNVEVAGSTREICRETNVRRECFLSHGLKVLPGVPLVIK